MQVMTLDLSQIQDYWEQEKARCSRVSKIAGLMERGWLEGPEGQQLPLSPGGIHRETGWLLYYLVRHLRPDLTVETGFGMGLSAMCVLAAHDENRHGQHIAMDPLFREWTHAAGLTQIEVQGRDRFHLLEHGSQWSLPQLHLEGILKPLGLAFIDGCHLFEYALLDFFYLDLALPVGGVLLIDDPKAPALETLLNFVEKNRKYHVWADSPFGCAILQKEGDDDRPWDHYLPFVASTTRHWGNA